MDRRYKKADRVHVYQSDPMERRLDIFEQQPHSYAGFDCYLYKDIMYLGFSYYNNTTVVYILLDRPLFKKLH